MRRNMLTRVLCCSPVALLRSTAMHLRRSPVDTQAPGRALDGRQVRQHPPAHTVYLYSVTIGFISFGAAFLSYHLLEKHFLALSIYLCRASQDLACGNPVALNRYVLSTRLATRRYSVPTRFLQLYEISKRDREFDQFVGLNGSDDLFFELCDDREARRV